MIVGIVVGVLVVLLILVFILSYNGLVRLRNRIDNAWSQIDVQLKRRHDLIPNLVETVKGYAAHERATFEEVTAARTRAKEAGGVADQAQAGTEQVAQAATFAWIGVGGREVAALEQAGDGLGILAVALGLGAVDGFHGPGMTEH